MVRSTQTGRGFTLLEVMIVLTIIGILAAIAIPVYQGQIVRSREAVLKSNLHTLRSLIDAYTVDRKAAPQTLADLVDAGYLREIPEDPLTQSSTTWQEERGDVMFVDQLETGIVDVRSGSPAISTEGTPYNTW